VRYENGSSLVPPVDRRNWKYSPAATVGLANHVWSVNVDVVVPATTASISTFSAVRSR
jgi:hypothetical protein